jgi:hypothetical protein
VGWVKVGTSAPTGWVRLGCIHQFLGLELLEKED